MKPFFLALTFTAVITAGVFWVAGLSNPWPDPKPSPIVLKSQTVLTPEQREGLAALDEYQSELDALVARAKADGVYSGRIKSKAEFLQKEIDDARQRILTGVEQ
jgi:hypothetical protein